MIARIAMPYETRPYAAEKKHLAGNLADRVLKRKLCEAGPSMCAECRVCEYGIEYLKRGLPVEAGVPSSSHVIREQP